MQPKDLEDVLDLLHDAGAENEVTVGDVIKTFGSRSHGPLLTVAGLLALSPLGGIPGVPTAMAIIIGLISLQLLLGGGQIWLPRVVRERAVERDNLNKAISVMRRPARIIDTVLRPRWRALTNGHFLAVTALCCVVLALVMPPLELVPFAVFLPAAAVTAFGMALLAEDGLVASIAFVFTGGALYLVATQVLG